MIRHRSSPAKGPEEFLTECPTKTLRAEAAAASVAHAGQGALYHNVKGTANR